MSKIKVKRNKKFVCSLVPFYICIDGKEVAQVKNGKEVEFDINEGTYELLISKIHYVDGKAKNSGYGGAIGAIVESNNKAKELNKTTLNIQNNQDILIECESNAVDCVILNVS